MKNGCILLKVFVTCLFLLGTDSLKAETAQMQSVQRVSREISNVATDYIPDVSFEFSSGKKALVPGNIDNFFSTKVFLILESQGKSATHLMTTLEQPYRGYQEEKFAFKAINSFSLRLWDIYAAALKEGISPSQLKVKLQIIKHTGESYQYDLTSSGPLEEVSLSDSKGMLIDQYKQLPLSFKVKMIGYRAKLFEKIWGWKELLPPAQLISSTFLSQYAQAKRSVTNGEFNINDLLDLFYAYSSGFIQADNYVWSDRISQNKQQDLVAYVVQKSNSTGIGSKAYWNDLISHFYYVEKVIDLDLSAQRYEIERVLNTEYPQGEFIQIMTSSTTNIVNNVTVNNLPQANLASTTATEEYYRYKLAREQSQQAAEALRENLRVFRDIRDNLPEILFPRL